MKYFKTLPSTAVTDQNNNIIGAIDLTARASLIPKLSLNPLLFYKYTI